MFVLLKSRELLRKKKSEESKNLNFRQRHLTENPKRQKEERQKKTHLQSVRFVFRVPFKTLKLGEESKFLLLCDIFTQRVNNNKSVIYLSSERERLKRKRERERKRVAVVVVVIAVVGVAKKRPWVVLRNEKSAARAFFSP